MTDVSSGSQWDAIIVGSGIGGLTAAAYLAANGKKALLLEQWDVLGGNSHVFRRKKFEFEVGLHYVGDCGPEGAVPTILGGLGLSERIRWLPMDAEGYDTLQFPEMTFKVPYGWDNYLANLIEAFPEERKALTAVVGIMARIGYGVDRPTTPGSLVGIAKLVVNTKTAAAWAMMPLSKLFDFYKLSPQARAVIGAQWGQHGCPPKRAPVVLHAGLLHNYIVGGAYFPHGGSQILPARLGQVVIANGGAIRTRATVEQILVENRRVTGVRLADGDTFTAPVVVSNADIKRTYLELVGSEHLKSGTVRKVANWRMSAPFVNVYLGVDVDLRETIPNTNYFHFASPDNGDGSYEQLIERAGDIPLDDWSAIAADSLGAFIHSSTVKDPDHSYAPPGSSSLEVMALAPADYRFWGVDTGPAEGGRYRNRARYLAAKERITDLLVDRAIAALPQIDGHIVWKEAATPITQERYTLCTDGSAYGIECSVNQFGPFRPKARTEIGGLFIAGSTTAWGPSVEGSMTSGVHAAAAVLERDLVSEVRAGAVFGDLNAIPTDSPRWDPLRASKGFHKQKTRSLAPEPAK